MKKKKKKITEGQKRHFELLQKIGKQKGITVKLIEGEIHYFNEKGKLICTEPIQALSD